MGRPRGRKRSRARNEDAAGEEEPALFPIGAMVEVRSDDKGFAGSYYEATVEGYLPSGRGYVVAYATLTKREDGRSPHREHVAATDVRPRPPKGVRGQRREFAVHEMVEAFHNEGWWAGVVRAVSPQVETSAAAVERPPRVYTVCFPTTREVLEFDEALLRPRLVFLGERWVPAAEAENRSAMFREGSQVEVSRSPKTFGESWSPATILKVIDATSFVVQYEDVREDGELVTEIMDAQYIRPGRNISRMDSKYRFRPSSFVEVFHEGSWWPGVILEVFDDKLMKKYVVTIKNHETDMEDVERVDVLIVQHTQLRPRYDWYGGKWVRCLTEKQFNRGPLATPVKRDECGSSIKEKKNNADAVLEPVCPDSSMCNENVQIKQKASSYPEETVKQENSVMAVTSPMSLPSQLSVSGFGHLKYETVKQENSVMAVTSPMSLPSQLSVLGFGHLKYDPKLFLSNQLQLPCPQMISMPSVPQTGQLQASLFGAFGQLRPLPQGPILGIQSPNPEFARIGGSKKAFTVHEQQLTDKGFYLMADPQQKINARLIDGTDLYRKRKECISSQTPKGLGRNSEIVLTKKTRGDKNAEETSQDISSSEEQMKSKSDYDKDLPDDAIHRSGVHSEINTVPSIDSTSLKDNEGSQERSIFLRESSVVDEIIPSGTDEVHQRGYIGALQLGAVKVSILNEHAAHSVITLDKPCKGNVLPSDSLTYQHRNKATEAKSSEISMEQQAVEEFCKQVLFVADDISVDLLPSTGSCEVGRNDHQQHKDNTADMVQLSMSCVTPTDDMPAMAVAMPIAVAPNLLPSSENCESKKKVDTVVEECQGNRMELRSIMPETQHVSADGPFSAASLPALKNNISIKQGLTMKYAADEHGVPHLDRSSPMAECAAECSKFTDKLALTQLSSADWGASTGLEHGTGSLEPKDAEGTPMSKYVPSRMQDSCRSILQRSLDVPKSILADRLSESLAVENLPFVKTSPMWAQIEAMEIFSKMPQGPNFHQFQQHVPEVREGMALGLMLSFANLGESIKKLNVQDDNSLFEEKMKGLSSLEAEGFDVTHLRSHLETLLHIKNGRPELQDAIKKLEDKIAHEETVDWQLGMQIGRLNSSIRQLHLHAYLLRGITQYAVSEKINLSVEISRLKAEARELKHLYVSAEERFTSPVAAPW